MLYGSCAVCCVSFWFWREKGFGSNTYLLLRVQYSCGGALVFCLQWEIVFGVLHILSVQYSCAVVSVFWLWREIDLKMRIRFYKKILLGYFFGKIGDSYSLEVATTAHVTFLF